MFITFDGTEGGGKTTQINALCQRLQQKNTPFIQTREPGGTALGEQIRHWLLSQAMCSDTELLLIFAARAEHIETVIKPALAKGEWVICDRFTDASYAYQGGGRGLDFARIQKLADWVQGDFQPHLTFILDIPVELGLQRAKKRGLPDKFEQETLAFFQRARQVYLDLAKQNPQRCRLIDGCRAESDIRRQIFDALCAHDAPCQFGHAFGGGGDSFLSE
jgi:dTMP kinase